MIEQYEKSKAVMQSVARTTEHYERVKAMMQRIPGQETPDEITIPDENTRVLRAKLILEEALETIDALRVNVFLKTGTSAFAINTNSDLAFYGTLGGEAEVDVVEVCDGCADLSVVTTGTLIAFGVPDKALLEEVDRSNLSKFEDGYLREDGKWCKGPNWTPPNIAKAIGL